MLNKTLKFLLKSFIVLFILINIVCIFQAYKLTHFYDGVGKLKKPEDMSTFEKVGAAIFGVKSYKQKSIDTFSIPHQSFTIKTNDSIALDCWYASPKIINDTVVVKPLGTVILFHGHASNKNGVIREATSFYNLGYNVFLVDFRAHGNSESSVCTIGYNESLDVKTAVDFIKSKGEGNIVLYGISLGAATILKAIATDSVKPNKIIIEMPFGTLHKAVQGRIKMMNLPTEPLSSLLTFWGGIEQGFWAFNMNPEEYAKSVSCPTLLNWGVNDARVSSNETESIYKNLTTSNKTLVEYKNSAHQSLCKNENDKWLTSVSTFLKQ